MLHRKIILALLVVGLVLTLVGCMGADQATIYCDSFRVEGISGDIVTDDVTNLDTDGDGIFDALQVSAVVTRQDTMEVVYQALRVVIPSGQSADGIGFTSDEFSFPAVPEGTMLQVDYISVIDLTGTSLPVPPGPTEVPLLSYTGACQLAPVDPTPVPTEEPTDEPPITPTPTPWKPEWWSPGDDRLNPDPHAYAAVYCDAANERVLIYGVNSPGAGNRNDSSGFFALEVPYSDLPPTPTGANTLIAEFENIRFYRTVDGEYAVVAGPDFEGKEYVVLFDGCPMGTVQRYILQGDRLQRTG